jgi:hypothetical protein
VRLVVGREAFLPRQLCTYPVLNYRYLTNTDADCAVGQTSALYPAVLL